MLQLLNGNHVNFCYVKPLYRGASLWDELDKIIQDVQSVPKFTCEIMKEYKIYVDLIN